MSVCLLFVFVVVGVVDINYEIYIYNKIIIIIRRKKKKRRRRRGTFVSVKAPQQ